jgi:hypothetical protein
MVDISSAGLLKNVSYFVVELIVYENVHCSGVILPWFHSVAGL